MELDKSYPGLMMPYLKGSQHARASMAREARRCIAEIPADIKEVHWDTLETWAPTEDGRQLQRVGTDFVEDSPKLAAYIKCMGAAAKLANGTRVDVPDGQAIGGTVQVHGDGVVYLGDHSDAEVTEEIAQLQSRISDTGINDDQRAVLRDQLQLFECYRDRGASHRRECLTM